MGLSPSPRRFSDRRQAANAPGPFAARPWRAWLSTALGVGLIALVWLGAGCERARRPKGRLGDAGQADTQGDLIRSVADSLGRLEEFDSSQMIPQVRDRLNQWVLSERPDVPWSRDPLVDSVAGDLAQQGEVKSLDSTQYSVGDVLHLQSTVWLRDIGRRLQTGSFDDLETAERLFDWTVRNLQLAPDKPPGEAPLHAPREILLTSRATAEERAWIFSLLARQCGLDVLMLALPPADDPAQPASSPAQPEQADSPGAGPKRAAPRPWAAALALDDKLYVFDPGLGLPIPGPSGKRTATLAELAADDSLLRALDLDARHRYPVTAEQLRGVIPWIEASPEFLARRMRLVESRLAGANKLALSVAPTALAARLATAPQLAPGAIWPLAYELRRQRTPLAPALAETLGKELAFLKAQPQLAAGRALEFKGDWDGPRGARALLLSARPSDIDLREKKLPPAARAALEAAKQNATFWLGTMAFEERDYPVAIDYFGKRMLFEAPGGVLAQAAQYNLARAYEANGEPSKAIELYDDDDSPQRHGNRLRARRLRAAAAGSAAR